MGRWPYSSSKSILLHFTSPESPTFLDFFSLLTRFLYFSTYLSFNDPHGQSTFNFPREMMPKSIPPAYPSSMIYRHKYVPTWMCCRQWKSIMFQTKFINPPPRQHQQIYPVLVLPISENIPPCTQKPGGSFSVLTLYMQLNLKL